jgi:hypothetical protein
MTKKKTKRRPLPKPRKTCARAPEPTLTEGVFSASYGGGFWYVRWPSGDTHRVNVRVHEAQMRVMLQFIRVAYTNGVLHATGRIRDALEELWPTD